MSKQPQETGSSAPKLCSVRDEHVPVAPPRSRLFSLELLGVGTHMVESLASYTMRLANAHSTSVSALLSEEVGPLYTTSNLLKDEDSINRSLKRIGPAMLSKQTIAAEMTRVLGELTLAKNLRAGTMLTWKNVLSIHALIRQHRAWCPVCFQGWLETDETISEPLIWSLQTITICPVHFLPLVSACPHDNCRTEQPVLHWRGQPGYCFYCNGWLGSAAYMTTVPQLDTAFENQVDSREERDNHESNFEKWTLHAVGELLKIAHTVAPPSEEMLYQGLRPYVGGPNTKKHQRSPGEIKALAELLGLSPGFVAHLRRGEGSQSLPTILKVCFSFGISIVDLLTGSLEAPVESFLALHRREVAQKLLQMEQVLQEALVSPAFPPLSTVARVHGYTYQNLQQRFPHLCTAIIQRSRNYNRQETKAPRPSYGPIVERAKRKEKALTSNNEAFLLESAEVPQKYWKVVSLTDSPGIEDNTD